MSTPRPVAFTLVAAGVLMASLLASGPSSAQTSEGVIRGFAFNDLDRDGDREPGESGVDETTICLLGTDFCDFTGFGEYNFEELPAGTYFVKLTEIPDGFRPTTPRVVRVVLGENEIRSDVDFGLTEIP